MMRRTYWNRFAESDSGARTKSDPRVGGRKGDRSLAIRPSRIDQLIEE